MRSRDPILDVNWSTICTPLELIEPDGRKREGFVFHMANKGVSKELEEYRIGSDQI